MDATRKFNLTGINRIKDKFIAGKTPGPFRILSPIPTNTGHFKNRLKCQQKLIKKKTTDQLDGSCSKKKPENSH